MTDRKRKLCEEKAVKRKWSREWLLKRENLSHHNLISEIRSSREDFRSYLRMDEDTYVKLLTLVESSIKKKDTSMRMSISADERLTATLRFLATGRSYTDLEYSTVISKHALSKIIPETCKALLKVLKDDYLKFPSTTEEWASIGKDFDLLWNFPNCGGALDGKHIRIVQPANSGSYYYNYKGFFSVVLMAIVNANYEFIYVHCGTNGRVSDGGVIENTNFYKKMKNQSLHLPSNEITKENLNYVFIGDEAFALQENLLKPYAQRELGYDEKIFNYRLSRARRVVENVFGIMAARFRIFHTAINLKVATIDCVVITVCALHNFLRRNCGDKYMSYVTVDREDLNTGTIINGDWRNENGEMLGALKATPVRNSTAEAKEVRNKYKHYFLGKGKVPWQDNMIE